MKKFLKFIISVLVIGGIIFVGAMVFSNLSKDNDDNGGDNNGGGTTYYCVSFDLNNYYGVDVPVSQQIEAGNKATEPNEIARQGYEFMGWLTVMQDTNETWNFEENEVNCNVVLYAWWQVQSYTIIFDMCGGNEIAPQNQTISYLEMEYDSIYDYSLVKVTEPDFSVSVGIQNPTKTGYVFAGWYVGSAEDNYTQEWNFGSDIVLGNMTLYAGWANESSNSLYTYLELANCIKITGYIGIIQDVIDMPETINSKTVISIGKEAFSYYNDSQNILLPTTLATINEKAFYNCGSLSQLTIPNGVTSIGYMAFNNCDNLYAVTLGSGLKNIGVQAFYDCSSLCDLASESLSIPSNVLSIENSAFLISGGALYNLTFSEGLVFIGESAFSYTYMLNLNLPNSLTTINRFAFQYCHYLTKVVFGKGISYIGREAFSSTNDSLYIEFKGTTPPTLAYLVFGQYGTVHGNPIRANFFMTIIESVLPVFEASEDFDYYEESFTKYSLDGLIVYPTRP